MPITASARFSSVIKSSAIFGKNSSILVKASSNEFGSLEKVFGTAELSEGNYDLYPCFGVLAEYGMNLNGLYFSKEMLVGKHASCRLKPFNLNHDSYRIIGVMYDSAICDMALDENNKMTGMSILSDDDYELDEAGLVKFKDGKLNGRLGVIFAAVLYGMKLPDSVLAIAEDLENNKNVAVSMEASFTDYKFILQNEKGESRCIEKTKENAYLKEYAGKIFGGDKVGILPYVDEFIFGGVGRVEKGAGPNSFLVSLAKAIGTDLDFNSENGEAKCVFHKEDLQHLLTFSKTAESSISAQANNGDKVMTLQASSSTTASDSTPAVDSAAAMLEKISLLSANESNLKTEIAGLKTSNDDLSNKIKLASEENTSLVTKLTASEKLCLELSNEKLGFVNFLTVLASDVKDDFIANRSYSDVVASLVGKSEDSVKEMLAKIQEDKNKQLELQNASELKVKRSLTCLPESATAEEVNKKFEEMKAGLKKPDATLLGSSVTPSSIPPVQPLAAPVNSHTATIKSDAPTPSITITDEAGLKHTV